MARGCLLDRVLALLLRRRLGVFLGGDAPVIGSFPLLRFPRWRRAPRTVAQSLVARLSPTPAPEPPRWAHKPPEQSHERAETCGEATCDNPVGEHESGEFCSSRCEAAWITVWSTPTAANTDPFHAPGIAPAPPADPAWLAAWSDWERAKAERLIAERKSPKTGEAA